mgnify:FL=1
MYFDGKGIEQDIDKALSLLIESAEQGNLGSEYALGYIYTYGDNGVEKDLKQAFAWY